MRASFLLVILGVLVGVSAVVPGQCLPPSWNPMNRVPGFDVMGMDLFKSAMTVWDPDGAGPLPAMLVVGGGFSVVGDTAVSRIAAWDGTIWQPLGTGVNGAVYALTTWNGDLIAGGWFSTAGGTPAANIARWNGANWQPLGSGMNGYVCALTVFNGDLIAGGTFTIAGGVSAQNVARWNGSWQSLGTGIVAPPAMGVLALATYGGSLIVGGQFSTAGGVSASSIARWDGSAWYALGLGVHAGSTLGWVESFAIDSGTLVVCGAFDTADTVAASNVARWNGTSWQPIGSGVDNVCKAAAVYNGELVVAGSFAGAGISPANRVARWNGSIWQTLGSGIGVAATGGQIANSLSVFGGELFVGGQFHTAGGVAASCIARWDGSSWHGFPGEIDGRVKAFAEQGGFLFAGGSFTLGNSTSRLARWMGGVWQPVGASMTAMAGTLVPSVNALASYNGDLVVAGNFDSVDGVPASFIVRWTGTGWVPLGSGTNAIVCALAVFNGDLIAAGEFSVAGGVPASHVARWNGSSWTSIGSITYAVGSLTDWNGTLVAATRNTWAGYPGILSWNGTSWQGIGFPAGAAAALGTFNGDLIAAGGFASVNGIGVSQVARFDGTTWWPLAGGITLSGNSSNWPPLSLTVHQGELILGGGFAGAGGSQTFGIAAWNGSSWHGLGTGVGGVSAGNFHSIEVLTSYHGALIAGGAFTKAGGAGAPYVARWSSPLPLVLLSQPGGSGTGVQIDNEWLVLGHDYFNLFSLDLCAGGPGTGPYGGLGCSDPNTLPILIQQALLPLGSLPFHYLASATSATFGPYPAPLGLTFDVLCVDSINFAAGTTGCLSSVTRYTTY
jgi:hypothetical protein